MRGINASTGRVIEGESHLRQSIADILFTPLGTRVMRREYGSLLPELVDAPFNASTRVRMYGAVATALMRWESRLKLTKVDISTGGDTGTFTITVEGRRTDVGNATDYTRITLPLSFRAS